MNSGAMAIDGAGVFSDELITSLPLANYRIFISIFVFLAAAYSCPAKESNNDAAICRHRLTRRDCQSLSDVDPTESNSRKSSAPDDCLR